MTKTFHIFWTGGWDSTYQILYSCLINKRRVQPIYIIDDERTSADLELKVMNRVRERLQIKNATAAELLLPVKMYYRKDIIESNDISSAYKRIVRHNYLGGQYEYLARFASNYSPRNIEMGILHGGNMEKILTPYLLQENIDGIVSKRIDNKYKDKDIYIIFGGYNFPIIDYSKKDLLKLSEKYGFLDILKETWSCHNPLKGNIPCGVCAPCTNAIENGFDFMFPEASIRNYKRSMKRRIYSVLRKFPYLYFLARKMKGLVRVRRKTIK